MGGSIAGFFKSDKNVQTKQLTPQEQQFNQIRLNQLNNANNSIPSFPQGLQNVYNYTNIPMDETQGYYNQARNNAFGPQFNQDQWYNSSAQGLGFDPYSQDTNQRFAGINQTNTNNFQNIDSSLSGLGDDLFQAGNSYYSDILGPQIGSDYSLMGLGRSGGRQEAEAKGAASIALPIQQQIAGFRNNAMLTNAAYQNQANLMNAGYQNQFQTQYLNNLFGLNMAQPQANIGLENAAFNRQAASAGFGDYTRQQHLQGNIDYSNLWLSALNATPFSQGTGTTSTGTSWGVSGQASAKVPGFG